MAPRKDAPPVVSPTKQQGDPEPDVLPVEVLEARARMARRSETLSVPLPPGSAPEALLARQPPGELEARPDGARMVGQSWTDTRPPIDIGGPTSPSADSPPEHVARRKGGGEGGGGMPEFRAGSMYRVQLSGPLEVLPGIVLSPSESHLIDGALAEQHKGALLGAKKET